MLAGLAFDDAGRRLQPTHAKKAGRRYRYYFRPAEGDERALRIPATELEAAVLKALQQFLRDERRLLDGLERIDASAARARIAAAAELASALDSMATVKRLVSRVVVSPQAIEIDVRTTSIGQTDASDEAIARVVVPAQIKRCGPGLRLIVRGTQENEPANLILG